MCLLLSNHKFAHIFILSITNIIKLKMAKPMANLFSNLEHEFESVQKTLSDIDANIRKVTGKDPRYSFFQTVLFTCICDSLPFTAVHLKSTLNLYEIDLGV